jgi:hypothetical protein
MEAYEPRVSARDSRTHIHAHVLDERELQVPERLRILRGLFQEHLRIMVLDASGDGPSLSSRSFTRQQLRDKARAYLRSRLWHEFARACDMDPEEIRAGLCKRLAWMERPEMDLEPMGSRRTLQGELLKRLVPGQVVDGRAAGELVGITASQGQGALSALARKGLLLRVAPGLYMRP